MLRPSTRGFVIVLIGTHLALHTQDVIPISGRITFTRDKDCYHHLVACAQSFVVWLDMNVGSHSRRAFREEGSRFRVLPRRRVIHLSGLLCLLLGLNGCINEFSVVSDSGSPLLISRRGYSAQDCTEKVKDEAARMGMTLRYVHIRGNASGRSLLWPFQPGYACEAAFGPEQAPIGTYPETPPIRFRGS